jgi:hypothetical protein
MIPFIQNFPHPKLIGRITIGIKHDSTENPVRMGPEGLYVYPSDVNLSVQALTAPPKDKLQTILLSDAVMIAPKSSEAAVRSTRRSTMTRHEDANASQNLGEKSYGVTKIHRYSPWRRGRRDEKRLATGSTQ